MLRNGFGLPIASTGVIGRALVMLSLMSDEQMAETLRQMTEESPNLACLPFIIGLRVEKNKEGIDGRLATAISLVTLLAVSDQGLTDLLEKIRAIKPKPSRVAKKQTVKIAVKKKRPRRA